MPKLFEWHWHRFEAPGLPVTMPALPRTRHFRWRGIYGLQIRSCFIGVILGEPGSPYEAPSPETDPPHPSTATGE